MALAVYYMFFGHGLIYIPGLVYFNIRASPTSPRLFKMSLVHVFYLLGFAIGTSVMSDDFTLFSKVKGLKGRTLNFAVVQLNMSAWILLGFLVYRLFSSKSDAKKSLDTEFQRINDQKQIFNVNDYQMLPQQMDDVSGTRSEFNIKNCFRIVFALVGKSQSFIYFFYPFHYINLTLTNATFYVAPWIGFVGALGSSVLLLKTTLRNGFIISCLVNIAAIFFLTSFTYNYTTLALAFYLLGYGYSYGDLCIICLTSLKYQEIFLFIGYSAEMIFIAEVYLKFVSNPYNLTYVIMEYFSYILPMSLCFVALAVGALLILPSLFRKSVLDTQDSIK